MLYLDRRAMGNEEWVISPFMVEDRYPANAGHPSPFTHRPICLAQPSAIIPRPDEISGLTGNLDLRASVEGGIECVPPKQSTIYARRKFADQFQHWQLAGVRQQTQGSVRVPQQFLETPEQRSCFLHGLAFDRFRYD